MKHVKILEKGKKRKKWGLILSLIFPISLILYFIASFLMYIFISGYDSHAFKIVFTITIYLGFIGEIAFIPGLIMLSKSYTDYNPNIKLKTEKSNLCNVYKSFFDITSLQSSDIQEMKYNGFIYKMKIKWAIVLNFITLGIFPLIYYGLRHSDLPKIRKDDFSAGKALGYLLIPFFNFYWVFVFWLRLVDRINFQYTIRKKDKRISRGLTIAYIVIPFIFMLLDVIFNFHYLSVLCGVIIGAILVQQIQNAINDLVEEKEYLNNI